MGAALAIGFASPGWAQGPEQVEELEVKKGDLLLEYYGEYGPGSSEGREHSGTLFYGVTDRLALGGELQTRYVAGPGSDEGLRFDYDSVAAVIRFTDPQAEGVQTGLWLLAGLDSDGEVANLEARLIVQQRTERVRAAANLTLRRVNQEAEEGAHLAYGGMLQFAVADRVWLGVEGSGQAFRIAGYGREPFDDGHYVGPSLLAEFDFGPGELGAGIAYFRRLDGTDELRDTARVMLQLKF